MPDPANPANLSAEARNVLAAESPARLLDSTEKQHVFRHIHAISSARWNFLLQIDSSQCRRPVTLSSPHDRWRDLSLHSHFIIQGLQVGSTPTCAEFVGASQNHEIACRIGVQIRNTREPVDIRASLKKKSLAFLGCLQRIGARIELERLRMARICFR